MNTSAGQGDGSPLTFYEQYGFEKPAKCGSMR